MINKYQISKYVPLWQVEVPIWVPGLSAKEETLFSIVIIQSLISIKVPLRILNI